MTARAVPVLVALLTLLVAATAFAAFATAGLRGSPAATNTALTDVGTTAEVTNALGAAVEERYSHDGVSAVVTAAAVQEIRGDRAVLVVFLDQRADEGADGSADPAATAGRTAAGRLTVVGERVDGRWLIADVLSP